MHGEFFDGATVGILAIAGLFNVILLAANPRNRAHAYFVVIPWATTLVLLEPIWTGKPNNPAPVHTALTYAALPGLLYWFAPALFPGLESRSDLAGRLATHYRRYAGRFIATPGAVGIASFVLLAGRAEIYADRLIYFFFFYSLPVLASAIVFLSVCWTRGMQAALPALIGFAIAEAAIAIDAYGIATGEPQRFTPAGMLALVVCMVIVLGANRYRMHRDLQKSREVLRESNRKLREIDAGRNRYIVGSAREMRAPLEAMQRRCTDIIEDPGMILHPRTAQAFGDVIDMASRMNRLFERVRLYFTDVMEQDLRKEKTDLAALLGMHRIVYEEEFSNLHISLNVEDRLPAAHVDPRLMKLCLDEMIDNATRHNTEKRTRVLWTLRRTRNRIEFIHSEPDRYRTPGAASNLIPAFVTGNGRAAGIGLGLSLIERIADLHGGRLATSGSDAAPPYRNGLSISFSTEPHTDDRLPEKEVSYLRFLLSIGQMAGSQRLARKLLTRYPNRKQDISELLALFRTGV